MEAHVKEILQECTTGSDQNRLTFPAVVGKLIEAGVEGYHADLRRAEKTYYMPNGETHLVAATALEGQPGQKFSAPEIEAALRAIQAGKLTYHEFCARIAAAGCVGYLVSIVGRRAVYFGRTGEFHVELFPAVK